MPDNTSNMLQDVDPKAHNIEVLPRHSVGIKVWIVHRIAGMGLLIYLLAHIATMGTSMFLGDEAFKKTFDVLFHTPIFIVADMLVLAGLVFHALNGIRIIIMEMGFLVVRQKHKGLLIATFAIAIILFVWLFQRAFI